MKIFKNILKITIFLIIILVCLSYISFVVKDKNSYNRKYDFFHQNEDFDVLFFGSSHALNTFFPMELYKNYGIISYNLANYSETIPVSYYNMLLSLKYKKPKLVVVDAFMIHSDEKINYEKVAMIHRSLDEYNVSIQKYNAIKDLFSENDTLQYEFEFLFPLSVYHSRWSKINESDFKPNISHFKGAEYLIKIAKPKYNNSFDNVAVYDGQENVSMEYLRKIIEYCKDNNIEILVTYTPFSASDKYISYSKYVQKICDEYNVNYLNFLDKNIINYNIDLYDNSHLNVSGARKTNDYLAEYIINNYNILDHRNSIEYSFWDDDYDKYIDYKIKSLKSKKEDLNSYLILLYNENDIEFEIKLSSKDVLSNGLLGQLLSNLNDNYSIDEKFFEKKDNKHIYIKTIDKRNNSIINELWF